VCSVEDVCYGPAWYNTWCNGECNTSCEFYTHTETSCFTYWIEDGWTPAGGGQTGGQTGGGSTGGSGGYPPPQCPGVAARNGVLPGNCQTGWIPPEGGGGGATNNPPNDSTIAANLKRLMMKVKDSTKNTLDSLHIKAQQDGNERAFSYRVFHNDTSVYSIVTGNENSSNPLTGNGIIGVNHTHQDNGLPATNLQSDANQTFDSDDIFKFYSDHVLSKGGKCLVVQTLTTRDHIYAAYITDVNQFKANIVSLAGTTIFSAMADNLYEKFDSLMNSCTSQPICTYERKSERALLAMFGGNNSGIRFYKSPKNSINFIRL